MIKRKRATKQKDTYVELEQHNDWGTLYVSEKGKGLSDDKFATASRELGLAFKDGMKVHIEWPNGEHELVKVVSRDHIISVSEHGHTSSNVTSKMYGIIADINGIETFVELHKLKVRKKDLPPVGEKEIKLKTHAKHVCK